MKPRNKELNTALMSKKCGAHGKTEKAIRKQENDKLKKTDPNHDCSGCGNCNCHDEPVSE